MKICDISKMSNNDLITQFAIIYSLLCANYNLNRKTQQLESQCNKMLDELLKRGLITETNINRLKNV